MVDEGKLTGGGNIAIKVPAHLWSATVAFYRDVVGLESIDLATPEASSVCFRFGSVRLWVDRVEALEHTQVWLELKTKDAQAAARRFASAGVERCDEIEPLPAGLNGFWIQSPASIIHLVVESDR